MAEQRRPLFTRNPPPLSLNPGAAFGRPLTALERYNIQRIQEEQRQAAEGEELSSLPAVGNPLRVEPAPVGFPNAVPVRNVVPTPEPAVVAEPAFVGPPAPPVFRAPGGEIRTGDIDTLRAGVPAVMASLRERESSQIPRHPWESPIRTMADLESAENDKKVWARMQGTSLAPDVGEREEEESEDTLRRLSQQAKQREMLDDSTPERQERKKKLRERAEDVKLDEYERRIKDPFGIEKRAAESRAFLEWEKSIPAEDLTDRMEAIKATLVMRKAPVPPPRVLRRMALSDLRDEMGMHTAYERGKFDTGTDDIFGGS